MKVQMTYNLFTALICCFYILTLLSPPPSTFAAQAEGYGCTKRRKLAEYGKKLGLHGLNKPNPAWFEENRPKDLTSTEEKSHGCIYAFLRGFNQGLKESGIDKLMQYFLYEKMEQQAQNFGYIHPTEEILQKL